MAFTIQGESRRTILLIDPDPHFRSGVRLALEAAGFSVGEAASGREGERTALRIRPDAILLDLMLESIDGGSLLAQRLREMGERFPIYLISNAADSLEANFSLQHLGISGVFAKPLDVVEMIATLRRRLQVS
jgi:DNA-binding response OmpR family regulator